MGGYDERGEKKAKASSFILESQQKYLKLKNFKSGNINKLFKDMEVKLMT